jgi:hypothetical protein
MGDEVDALEEGEVAEAPATDLDSQPAPLPGFPERTLGFMASADARLDSAQPDTPLGGETRMRVDASPASVALLRFQVSSLFSPVVSAKLRLYSTAPSTGTPHLFQAPGGWREATVTWNSWAFQPGVPVALAPRGVPDEAWVEFDVTNVITQDGIYDFQMMIDSEDGASFITRESTLYALTPQLLIDTQPNNCQAGPVLVNEARWPDQTVAVASTQPDTRLLRPQELTVDGDPRQEAYLRFGVDHRGRKLASAKLRLWAESASSDGPALLGVTPGTWGGTTWNTRPSTTGAPLADVGAVSAGSWVEYDVTAALAARSGPPGTGFSFEVALRSTSGDGLDFTSPYHRYISERPHLALTYEVPCPDPVEGQ